MKKSRSSWLLLGAMVFLSAWGCASSHEWPGDQPDAGDGDVGGDGGSVAFSDATSTKDAACTNLECQIPACGTTTLTGQVLDPAGRNPLYNVVAYIPNAAGGVLDPIAPGINTDSCSCGALFSGDPLSYALTDTSGKFTLTNVPAGANIPLVVQIGKWRKEIIVPTIAACTSNDAGKITLPKNLQDGNYASMPNIAVSTGGADTLECLLARMGIDEAVFTGSPTGQGVHVFQGTAYPNGGAATGAYAAPGSPSSSAALWDSEADLSRYDIVMLSCEGMPTAGVDAATATRMAQYINAGGRVFAEHYHYAFFVSNNSTKTPKGTAYPEFANLADWEPVGSGWDDNSYLPNIQTTVQTTLPNNKPFPEGAALQSWLGNVGALSGSHLTVQVARQNALVGPSNLATPWVQYLGLPTDPNSTQYFSWDMPFDAGLNDAGVPQYCGRAVFSDMHVSGGQLGQVSNDYKTSTTVPTGCDSTSALSPDEDAIEFILFDLSSCITPAGSTPVPPPK
jgi:hypothetical protein